MRTKQIVATRGWIGAHRLITFFSLAYAISWVAWTGAYLGLGMAGVVVGGFGPAVGYEAGGRDGDQGGVERRPELARRGSAA
jgi:hypothetical protein